MNSIIEEMLKNGHVLGEFDYSDPYYLHYEDFFKTGMFKEIIISATFMFSSKRDNIDFETYLPKDWMLMTEADMRNPYKKWPNWAYDFNTLTKVTLIYGIKKMGKLRLLHVVVYNSADPPYNAQLDFFANDILEWHINGGNIDQLLHYYKYSCGRISLNFGDRLIDYCERSVKQDPDFFIIFNNLLIDSMMLCQSLLEYANLIFADTTSKIVQHTFKLCQSIRTNL